MNNFLEVFNDELKKVKEEHRNGKSHEQHDENLLEVIEKDMAEITGYYQPVIESIKEKFKTEAEVQNSDSYKADEEITISYKANTVISYQLQKDKTGSGVPASYRIKIGGILQLPDMLVQTSENGHYYYFEDKYTSKKDKDKDDLVGIPYQDSDGVVESNQFEKVIEKHMTRLARYVGKDNL